MSHSARTRVVVESHGVSSRYRERVRSRPNRAQCLAARQAVNVTVYRDCGCRVVIQTAWNGRRRKWARWGQNWWIRRRPGGKTRQWAWWRTWWVCGWRIRRRGRRTLRGLAWRRQRRRRRRRRRPRRRNSRRRRRQRRLRRRRLRRRGLAGWRNSRRRRRAGRRNSRRRRLAGRRRRSPDLQHLRCYDFRHATEQRNFSRSIGHFF